LLLKTDRQTEGQRDRQRDRETDRGTERERARAHARERERENERASERASERARERPRARGRVSKGDQKTGKPDMRTQARHEDKGRLVITSHNYYQHRQNMWTRRQDMSTLEHRQ
jgi:hypothetical protein